MGFPRTLANMAGMTLTLQLLCCKVTAAKGLQAVAASGSVQPIEDGCLIGEEKGHQDGTRK